MMLSMGEDGRAELALLVADVYELAGTLRRHGEAFAASVGQTQARWQLLSVLSDGDWTVPQAARRLGVSRQAVQRVADDLDAEGLVRYVPNPHHQRSAMLELTPHGTDALAKITTAANRWQSVIASDLDPSTLQQTRQVLRQILARIADADQPTSVDRGE
ncbi:MAG: MarR family winged helix-turn-helix transcriptional regulator [Ilumatobacteraceae bacterium]